LIASNRSISENVSKLLQGFKESRYIKNVELWKVKE
jgi:hypothetical protein